MNWFKKYISKRSNYPVTKHETKYAFTCGGVDYYQFDDFNNTPAMRGMKTVVFFEEMKMKCTVDFLKLHVEAVDNLVRSTKIDIFEIKKLNDQLKQRLDLALDHELIYKLASIVFFDKKENIEDFDFGYNAKKIQHWKKHLANDFFLLQPLQELVPVLKDIEGNFQMYSQVVQELNQLHLDNLLSALPIERTRMLKDKSYSSLAVTPHQ
jgi:hypothetical protein